MTYDLTILGTAVKYEYSNFLIGPKSSDSHALVDFGDDGTAVIPFSRIVEGSISDGRCRVSWSDGKEYDAALTFTGKELKRNK